MKITQLAKAFSTICACLLALGFIGDSIQTNAAENIPLPSRFDLRERGVVTSVKSQEPFNSCWAFGGTAAAETSILTELGMSAAQYQQKYGREFDLSEKHLAWWAYHAIPEREGGESVGEGVYLFGEGKTHNRNKAYEIGGMPYLADEMFSVGTGPTFESYAPYEGVTGGGRKTYGFGGDWTLPDKTRYHFSFELMDGNRLPSPAKFKTAKDGSFATDTRGDYIYTGYDADATKAIKNELYRGRGVAVSYRADISTSQQRMTGKMTQKYMSENWAQYTDDKTDANHVICIVGWDDGYPVENFNAERQPPAPGAWLCKNSWGSGEAPKSSHNYLDEWGIVNENGEHTGYFWLSYYDHSICEPESMRFAVSKANSQNTIVNSYDNMQGGESLEFCEKTESRMANIFTASRNQRLKALGTNTVAPNTQVRFDVFKQSRNAKRPTDGRRIATKTETFEYAGFHRISLGRTYPIKKGERISVMCTQTTDEKGKTRYWIVSAYGAGEQAAKKWQHPYYSQAIVNEGESFYGIRNKLGVLEWEDWADTIEEWKEEPSIDRLEIDNFPIKMYSAVSK